MRYKRAFFVAFIITVVGLGLWWYSSNQIDLAVKSGKIPSFEWFEYQFLGMMIFGFGIALFTFFIGTAIKKWIGL